jgi:photosystem II stability/assembly factor-like uncharacterized protein
MLNTEKARYLSGKNIYPGTLTLVFVLFILNSSLLIPDCMSQWVQNGLFNGDIASSFITNGNTIFVGIGWPTPGGVYKSTNNGDSWFPTSLTGSVRAFTVSGNNIFVGIYGVFLSTDNGTSWAQTSLINHLVRALTVSGNNVFAGTSDSGVYKSTNNGTNWIQTSLNNKWVNALEVNGNNIFAGIYNYPSPYGGVYLSANNGSSWTQTSLSNKTVWSLAVNGNYIFAGTDYGISVSTDNGIMWAQTPLNNYEVRSLTINGNNVFAGTDNNGVYLSTDNGTTWTQRNEGLANSSIEALCISNNYIFAGTNGNGVYRRPLSELIGIKPISEQIPSYFSISQNYPNPFNPTTKIKFDIPNKGLQPLVHVRVYDILGKEAAILVNQQLQPGTYEVEWDASNQPSGVYFYKISAGEFIETKKMVFIK